METNNKEEFENTEIENLELVRVGDGIYQVFNRRTGRYHDLELGIDTIPDEKIEILAEVVENGC